MTHSITTISSMGQPDQYQPRCKECDPPWGGDIHKSRATAMKEGLEHDANEHEAITESADDIMPAVDEILAQLELNTPKLGPLYAAHMNACIDNGFTREEALVLTSDWARVTLWGAQL